MEVIETNAGGGWTLTEHDFQDAFFRKWQKPCIRAEGVHFEGDGDQQVQS
jgi:hypothetical protein